MLTDIITAITPIIVPIVVSLFKGFIPKIPKWLLPITAVLLGVGADYINEIISGASLGAYWGAALGAAGVGIREIFDQVKKSLT